MCFTLQSVRGNLPLSSYCRGNYIYLDTTVSFGKQLGPKAASVNSLTAMLQSQIVKKGKKAQKSDKHYVIMQEQYGMLRHEFTRSCCGIASG